MSYIVQEYISNFLSFYNNLNNDIEAKHFNNVLEIEKYAKINNFPISRRETIKLISVLAKIGKAKNILEVGTGIGYFSIYMRMLGFNVTTIEKNEKNFKIAKQNLEETKLNNVKLIFNDAILALKDLKSNKKKFEMIYIDAGKSHYLSYFQLCIPLLKTGGTIISDNVLFRGLVAKKHEPQNKYKTISKNMKNFLNFLETNENFITSVLSVGDGLAISFKK